MKPLRLMMVMGLTIFCFSLLGTLYTFFVTMDSLLIPTIVSLGGLQIFCLGIVGEYVGRALNETRRRPLFLVRDEISAKVMQKEEGMLAPAPEFLVVEPDAIQYS